MKNMKKVLSLVLALVMVFSIVLPASAANTTEAVEFVEIDNDTVKPDLSDRVVESEADEPQYSSSDIVRVSIVLEGASTIDAGYSTSGIADNAQAMAYRESLEQQQAKMEQKISHQVLGGKKLDVVWNLTLAANIISANVAYGKIEAIKALDGVEDVVIEQQYEPMVVSEGDADPDMATSSEMIGSTGAYLEGYTGAGMRIAVIDTGVDTQHLSFDGGAFEYSLAQNAAEKGMSVEEYKQSIDLLDAAEIAAKLDQLNIGELLDAQGITADQLYISSKLPFGFNYVDDNLTVDHLSDTEGEHGSHVSGIATANAYVPDGDGYVKALDKVCVQGVAPDAQLITMKVFGANGGAYDSDYMVAIEDAIILGCDSVNLSLGSGNPGSSFAGKYQDVMDSLAESDTVVVMSAGNSGAWTDSVANGIPYLYSDDVSLATNGTPGSYTNSFAVASVDNIGTTGIYFSVDDLKIFFNESDYTNAPITSLDTSAEGTGTEYDYVLFANYGADGDGNNLMTDYANVTAGKVVLVSRGTSSFYQKHMAVEEVGGIACIVYNNTTGTINMDLTDSTATIPCVSITQSDAEGMIGKSEAVTAEDGTVLYYTGKITISGKVASGITSDTYTMSSFSSWGVPGSLELKPEITAPGGNIYSVAGANINETSGSLTFGDHASYENMSGTSMAAPQITGLSALLIQYMEENGIDGSAAGLTKRALAQSLLMSTAVPVIEEDSGYYYSVMKQGAGVANIANAIAADSYIKVDGQDDGKVKVELGDDPDRTGTYTTSFSINNLTEEALQYNLSADFFTQDVFGYNGAVYLDTLTAAMETSSVWTVDGVTVHPFADLAQYDFDGDGDTDADDASALMDFITGKREEIENADCADVDGDGAVATADVYELLKLLSSTKVTVPANGSVKVTLTISLSEDQKEFFDAYYPNGAYVEGYIYATPDSTAEGTEGVEHSIPVLGFYGNWSDPSMYDVGSLAEFWYGTETRAPYLPDSEGNPETLTNYMSIRYAGENSEHYYFGNPLADDDEYLPERNAFNNENGDTLYKYYFSVIRNAGNSKYVISDAETGEVYMDYEVGEADAAFYYTNGSAWRNTQYKLNLGWRGTDAEGNKLPEGTKVNISLVLAPEYYANEDGTYDWDALGEGAYLTTMTTIDNTAPVLTGVYRSLTDKKLMISAVDNEYISVIAVYDETGEKVLAYEVPNQTVQGEEQTVELDLNEYENERMIVVVYDYAMNSTAYKLIYNEEDHSDEKTTSLTLDPTSIELLVGNTAKINATVEPWIVNDPLVWTSSDETVATVSAGGVVTGVGAGECVITATSVLTPEISATCDVTVKTVDYTILGLLQDESGNPMSFIWDLSKSARWTKIADVDSSLCSATLSRKEKALTAYVMDSTDALKMREVDLMSGETVAEGNSSPIPYWDMATSIFGTENGGDMIHGIYAYYVFACQDPMAPTAAGYDLSAAISKYTGAKYLTAMTSAGYYYDSDDECDAELIWAMDDAGYIWLFEYTAKGSLYLFNFYATDLELEFPGYESFMQCSIVEALDGSALFLSYFDGVTNVIYMLEPVLDGNGHIGGFAATCVGDVGQDVWPASIVAVIPGEGSGDGAERTASLAEKAADASAKFDTPVKETAVSEIEALSEKAAKGSLNAVTTEVTVAEKPTDADTVTVQITADAAVNNGLYEITYNAEEMEFVSAASNVQIHSFNATEGKVVFGFASETAVEKDGVLATLTFKNKEDKCYGELSVAEVELGTEPETVEVAFGHTPEVTPAVDPTCTETGLTEGSHCAVCGEVLTEQEVVSALGHDMVIDVAVAPTCTESGLGAGCHCSRCDAVTVEQIVIAPLGHTAAVDPAVAPTCTETGLTEGSHCAVCGEVLVAQETVSALGHTPVVDPAVEATLTSTGLTEGSHCAVCGEILVAQEIIPMLEDTVCYHKNFTDCTDTWYHEAVDFTVSEGLMSGIGGGKFDPNGTMTRAMMVTVLYRMAGSPAVSGPSSFTDVPEGQWYSDAIAWAQDNGIVLGVLADKFDPNGYVTREQIATILWRYENKPEVTADLSSFKDAASISEYAVDAMTWAVSEGIFQGDAGNLKPTAYATRAEFACIIMRYLGGSYACEAIQ